MDISTSIVPKKSLGGISIGEQIDDVIARLSNSYTVERTINRTTINNGLITAYHDDDGFISTLSCNSKFKGNYKGKIWPGMTVSEVIKNTSRQVAWTGFVQVDQIEGVGLSLPNELDDFEQLSEEFDESYVFEELWVYE